MSTIVFLIVLLAAGQNQAKLACKLNLLFVIDGSSSVCGAESCSNWTFTLQFIHNIIDDLDVGSDDTMVALITVSDRAMVEWNLYKFPDKTSLLTATDNVVYLGGDVSETDSLNKLITSEIFNFAPGDKRRAFHDVTVLITDGAPMISTEKGAGSSDAFYKTGIKGFVVCVMPGCSDSFAKSIAQPPKKLDETYFLANGFPSIDLVRKSLMKQLCPT